MKALEFLTGHMIYLFSGLYLNLTDAINIAKKSDYHIFSYGFCVP